MCVHRERQGPTPSVCSVEQTPGAYALCVCACLSSACAGLAITPMLEYGHHTGTETIHTHSPLYPIAVAVVVVVVVHVYGSLENLGSKRTVLSFDLDWT